MNPSSPSSLTTKSEPAFRYPQRTVSDIETLQRTILSAEADGDKRWNDVSNFWNPGPATLRENAKLRLLHGITVGSGCFRPVFGRIAKSNFGILTYHRITPKTLASRDGRVTKPSINVSPGRFYEQLSGLQKKGFQFRSLSDVIGTSTKLSNETMAADETMSGEAAADCPPERVVVVTFDDIYDNVFHNAWPVLQELNIPATVFVSTAYLDSADPFPFDHWAQQFNGDVPRMDWRPIQHSNLEQMLGSDLIEVGAHTHTHQDFRTRPDDFAKDLDLGIQKLKERFSVEDVPFAFPYGVPRLGFANQQLMRHVCNTRLTCGLTTGSHTNQLGSSPFGWGRFHVFEHDTVSSLAAKLDGYYEWLPELKNRVTSVLRK